MKQTLYTTIAYRNPKEAYNLLAGKGYNKMKKDSQVIAIALADYVTKNQDSALAELAKIHPDKELFQLETEAQPLQPIISNCDGCEKLNLNVDAAKQEGKKFSLSENNINIMIVSGALIFTLTAIVILIRKTK
jgi:hypothetical protein